MGKAQQWVMKRRAESFAGSERGDTYTFGVREATEQGRWMRCDARWESRGSRGGIYRRLTPAAHREPAPDPGEPTRGPRFLGEWGSGGRGGGKGGRRREGGGGGTVETQACGEERLKGRRGEMLIT
jgi:hypothetical protein